VILFDDQGQFLQFILKLLKVMLSQEKGILPLVCTNLLRIELMPIFKLCVLFMQKQVCLDVFTWP
jgi:hypothetical protein